MALCWEVKLRFILAVFLFKPDKLFVLAGLAESPGKVGSVSTL